MSHVNTYQQTIQNIDFFLHVCKQRGHEVILGTQTVNLYGTNAVKCIASVKIEGWQYPIAVTEEGELKYDHWGSQPGTMEQLGLTIQDYNDQALANAIPYDEIMNHYKETLENGDIRVTLEFD